MIAQQFGARGLSPSLDQLGNDIQGGSVKFIAQSSAYTILQDEFASTHDISLKRFGKIMKMFPPLNKLDYTAFMNHIYEDEFSP